MLLMKEIALILSYQDRCLFFSLHFFHLSIKFFWLEVLVHCWTVLESAELAVDFSQIPFIMLKKFPSTHSFLKLFSWQFVVFWQFFSASIELMIWFFFLTYWDSILHWLSYVETILYSWNKLHSVMTYKPFNMLLDFVG